MEPIPSEETGLGPEAMEAPDGEVLGKMIRDARKEKGLTLEEAARAAAIGRSTLSKIENNQTRPSFEIIRRLMQTLELETPQLFVQSGQSGVTGRRDFTRTGLGEHKETSTYDHELLCSELTSKRMVPYISTIKARDVTEFDNWVRHQGEEFMFVLSGELILYTEHYRPLRMGAGDSVYYDSGMGHGCVSVSKEDARVLWVSLEV
ncbi:XRE family transcriptional regulator [Leisingera sp. M527]|uniref:helix-turn-helix domain-containing protein n=1 Tax=unclassified Leisingera TaxID=2614906 RepID=UPI00101269D5|nr:MULTISPECIES: XRE family transcriptional regulator [unclassified Leisingera]MBQ4823604.1 helix-turn-helix transcriptional regulator [Leisingera sp. HS039]QAX30666.1 XRE family transcriptional regulator [Leisingera sp. NJS204]QBR37215.1 XRE family transcriptional regulator [Leisingera sp. NJS201]UWQ32022.1 XRE family transcriptional regulator [Leisingera sp. M527]